MAFRTVVVDTHSKLEYSLNYLVYRTPDLTKRVLLDEIHTVILQSTAVSITTSLICELVKPKIKVIFCDEKQNPMSELFPLYGSHNCSKRIKEQIEWSIDSKESIWQQIIIKKIKNQAQTLKKHQKIDKASQLFSFANEVEKGDATNREGHAAKVYFNSVFFAGFNRDMDCPLNAYLNYGYTIILSQINRAIVSNGYLTQIGIHHKNEFNQFNLSCDLIEPLRFLVDEEAMTIAENENFKEIMQKMLAKEVLIGGVNQTLSNAINIYINSVFNALNDEKSKIMFVENDL